MNEAIISMVVGLRQQVDAMGSQIDAVLSLLVGQEQGCKHPPEKRQQLGMGSTAWQCKQCGFIYQGGD